MRKETTECIQVGCIELQESDMGIKIWVMSLHNPAVNDYDLQSSEVSSALAPQLHRHTIAASCILNLNSLNHSVYVIHQRQDG